MQAIKHLYKIGYGPSSSHTIAPYRFGKLYKKYHPDCSKFEIVLGGSLALTGKGHGTIRILSKALETNDIDFKYNLDSEENSMVISCVKNDKTFDTWHAISIGGGSIEVEEYHVDDLDEIYPHNSFEEIKQFIAKNNISLVEYCHMYEPDLFDYLDECLQIMFEVVEDGLKNEGLLNADLNYYRVAKKLYEKAKVDKDYLIAYSYAALEENAAGHMMCTAPTLGSCGVLTSLMYFLRFNKQVDLKILKEMLIVGGIFGNLVKQNATIAGSIGGCQAEIGTACSMACAAISYFNKANLTTIEYAAEMGIEHYLGLTCDPVMGYVIIPCIERNAVSLLKAYECSYLANQLTDIKKNQISFDSVVKAMNYTGKKIAVELKETSLGGLSLEFKREKS